MIEKRFAERYAQNNGQAKTLSRRPVTQKLGLAVDFYKIGLLPLAPATPKVSSGWGRASRSTWR